MRRVFRNLTRISWWQLLIGILLVVAEAHYFAFPLMRAGEVRTPMMEWLNAGAQVAFLVTGCWMVWASTGALRNASQRRSYLLPIAFATGCAAKHFTWSVDPLDRPVLTLAYSMLNIGSEPGRGWDMAVPPLPQQVAWYAIYYAAFGVECVTVVAVVTVLWRRVSGRVKRGYGS